MNVITGHNNEQNHQQQSTKHASRSQLLSYELIKAKSGGYSLHAEIGLVYITFHLHGFGNDFVQRRRRSNCYLMGSGSIV